MPNLAGVLLAIELLSFEADRQMPPRPASFLRSIPGRHRTDVRVDGKTG